MIVDIKSSNLMYPGLCTLQLLAAEEEIDFLHRNMDWDIENLMSAFKKRFLQLSALEEAPIVWLGGQNGWTSSLDGKPTWFAGWVIRSENEIAAPSHRYAKPIHEWYRIRTMLQEEFGQICSSSLVSLVSQWIGNFENGALAAVCAPHLVPYAIQIIRERKEFIQTRKRQLSINST